MPPSRRTSPIKTVLTDFNPCLILFITVTNSDGNKNILYAINVQILATTHVAVFVKAAHSLVQFQVQRIRLQKVPRITRNMSNFKLALM